MVKVLNTLGIVKCVSTLALAISVSACSTTWLCEETDKKLDERQAGQITEKLKTDRTTSTSVEFIAQLEPGASLDSLRLAWAIFSPELSWIGPPNSGFLKITIHTGLGDANEIMALLGATKGVVVVEINTPATALENEVKH